MGAERYNRGQDDADAQMQQRQTAHTGPRPRSERRGFSPPPPSKKSAYLHISAQEVRAHQARKAQQDNDYNEQEDEFIEQEDELIEQRETRTHREQPAPRPRPRAGTPRPRRARRPRQQYEHSPWDDFRHPPKKGLSIWKAIGMLFWLPFGCILFFTRHAPKLLIWPLRLALSGSFFGIVAIGILALIYGFKSNRYDITQIQRMPERSIVLDRRGTELGTLHGENRRSIEALHEEVPNYFIEALILQEDRSFRSHMGVDPRGILRAVMQVFKHRRTTQGASTLTMQLAKNTYNHRERTFDAKFTEVALARRIEASYSKDEILRCYINRIFWGHTFMGLKQAAYGYFNKIPRDLSIGESALLAGIICSPNEFSPHRKPTAAKVQRNKVLMLMLEHGKITHTQYEVALAEPVTAQWPKSRGEDNYVMDLVRREVDHILRMLDSQRSNWRDQVMYNGGLRVQTSIDVDLQDAILKQLDAQLCQIEHRSGYRHRTRAQYQTYLASLSPEQQAKVRPDYLQAACVVLHHGSGALLAIIGGRDSQESALNRAIQSRRQVGSLFKPLVYASFFERGGSPSSLISDDRIRPGEISGSKRWSPRNVNGTYTGLHPASWGLLKSRNTMAVRVGEKTGLKNIIARATLAGFTKGPKDWLGPTIYLGTWEATPFQVASAFGVFANGGVRATPYIIESIQDETGHYIWQRDPTQIRVFSQRATQSTSQIMEKIMLPGGTGGSRQRLGFLDPCGGKTGTTNKYMNAWFCGFSSELTSSVWVGFDRQKTIIDRGYGSTLALPIWVKAMNEAKLRGYPMKAIHHTAAKPAAYALRLCRSSKSLAHKGCEYMGCAYTESMADREQQRGYCEMHDLIAEEVEEELQAIDPKADGSDDILAEDPDSSQGELWAIDPLP